MTALQTSSRDRAEMYAKSSKLTIEKELGGGYDGVVLATNKGTAIKAFRFTELYRQELTVYQYLAKWRITEVNGFHIPRLVGFDNNRAIIEMTVVSPPFVVDFVGARIEMPIHYDDEWYEQKNEEFEDDWPTVRCVIWGLQEHGIYLSDVHPGNIRCR